MIILSFPILVEDLGVWVYAHRLRISESAAAPGKVQIPPNTTIIPLTYLCLYC